MLLALIIFLVTLTFVIWQPRGLGIGWSALAGAGVALLTGVVHLSDVPDVWALVWNATLTFVAVILISLVLDEAGTFEWSALHVARWGKGNGRRLFTLIVILGAAIAAVFANDGAALILTPIVFQMMLALKFSPAASFAFIMATGFVADTTSLPLVVSNLVNIVSADFFGIGFARYALVMIPVSLVSLAATLGVLRLFFRKSIPDRYDVTELGRPEDAVRDRLTFRAGWVVLAVLLVGYFVAEPLNVPLSAVASVAALAIIVVAARRPAFLFRGVTRRREPVSAGSPAPVSRGPIAVWPVVRSAPWQVVIFSLGMYLVVYGLRNAGLTDTLGEVFAAMAGQGTLAAGVGTGFLVAGMSSVMNNMPTVLVAALGIDAAGASGVVQEIMIYANVIGADLGPKITPIGSLATLLWLHVLDRKGMHIGWGQYFRIGIILTLPVLAVTLLGLVAWLTVLH
ncbi:arsenic transporter [Promicromonospora iranensis]